MKKYIYIGLAVILVVIVIYSIRNENNSLKPRLTIGAPLSLTGDAVTDGQNIQRGIELAKDDLAKKGIEVRVIYEDDGTDPKRTVTSVNKLIGIDKVDALIGPTWSFLYDAVAPIFDKAQVVAYAPANTSEFENTRSAYAFYGATKNAEKRVPIAEWLTENNKKKVAIIVDKSAWGESNLTPFTEAAKDAGAEVVLIERIPFGAEKDTMPTVLAKSNATNADVILTTGYEEGLTILINRVNQQGPHIPVLVASDLPKTLLKNGQIKMSPDDQTYIITTEPSKEFTEKFHAKYNEAPGNYSDRAYDGLMMIAEAYQNKEENESIAGYLHNETNYQGYATTYKFDQNGDIVGGKWVIKKLQ